MGTGAINYENLKVDGYNLDSIRKIKIETSINNHGTLRLTGILKVGEEDKIIDTTSVNKTIKVYKTGDEAVTLFNGIVTKVEVTVEGQLYILKVEAKSRSYQMDIQVKSRSFQDLNCTTHNLIKTIMGDYAGSNYILNIPNEPIKELLVQYEETDWEFLKRIASKYNQGLFPTCNSDNLQYVLGVPEKNKTVKTPNLYYEVYKDLDDYEYMKNNYLPDAKETDYLTYKIKNYEVIQLGDNITFQGKTLYVNNAINEMKEGILENTYILRPKNGLRQKRVYNTKVVGSSIDGKIISVEGTTVKIHLEIDKDQPVATATWFKFSTMSASKDGSGWYCMPEVGDSVRVYFPTKDEDQSFAVSAVHGYEASGGGEDRMGNPDNKYLRTANDKEVKLTPNGVAISCNSGQADVHVLADGTVSITSQNNINVQSSGNIKIDAQKSFLISAKKEVSITCDKNAGIVFDEEGQVRELGTQVNNN